MFDPLHKWLGIPAAEQPPNHYRLLGISLFEGDQDVIEGAADRQMGFIRQYQAGEHGQVATRILNELASVRLCLLKPAAKAAYDQKLRQELAGADSARKLPASSKPVMSQRFLITGGGLVMTALLVAVFISARGVQQPRTNSTDSNDVTTAQSVDEPPALPMTSVVPTTSVTEPKREVDLLALVNAETNAIAGEWHKVDGVLESPKAGGSRIEVPYPMPNEYDLSITVEPLDMPNGFVMRHLMAGRRFRTVFNILTPAPASFVEYIDGLGLSAANPTFYREAIMEQDRRTKILCVVRKGAVIVTADEKPILEWKGEPEHLMMQPSMWDTPHDDFFMLGVYGCRYRIHEMTLTPFVNTNN